MAMSHDEPHRPGGFLPPPPSTPDDGPTALELPPLQPPPKELQAAARGGRIPLRTWLMMIALFVFGTAVSYYFQR